MIIKTIENFPKGLITDIEAKSIPRGSSSDILNWEHLDDKIELRRGMLLIGTEQTGTGKITGIHTTRKADGTEVTYIKRGRKLLYYDTTTEDWIEVGTNLFPVAATNDEMAFADYITNQGNQMWFSSPNSSLYKIMTANPGDVSTMYDSTKNFKGYIDILLNRMFLWFRNDDKSGVRGSYIDNLNNTAVADEAFDTGDGGKSYSGTLVFKAGDAQRTCFGITANDEDSTETFTDDYSGILTGSAGGSGTINYTTGAITLIFNANVTIGKEIRASYSWEDSTNNGIADFTKSDPRTAGQGFIFRQDSGGDIANVKTYNDIQYCLHEFNTWRLNIGVDDTEATNRIYRENTGITNWRASVATGDGIYIVDDSQADNPKFRLLQLETAGSEVIPISVSDNLDLSPYRFDASVAVEHGDTIRFAMRTKGSTVNNREFVYNKKYKTWQITDYQVSCYAKNSGALWSGDSITDNVYELLSGFDDDESTINNFWVSSDDDLDIEHLKKTKRLRLQGDIQRDQSYDVYFNYDNSGFVKVGTVTGTGDYVDFGQAVNVGSPVIGKTEIGGGSTVFAYNYLKEIVVKTDKFQKIRIKYIATGIGYVSVSKYQYKDVRSKSTRIPSKYR